MLSLAAYPKTPKVQHMRRPIFIRTLAAIVVSIVAACAWIGYTLWNMRDDALVRATRNTALSLIHI